MRNNNSFIFYESFWKNYCRIKDKDPAGAQEMLEAIIKFGLYNETPDENSLVWIYGLEQSFTSIEAAQDHRQKAIDNGKRGGRPSCDLDKEQVYELKKELKTWKAVAEELKVDEKTLRAYRKKWDEEEKTEKTGKTEAFSGLLDLEGTKREKPEKANVNLSSSLSFDYITNIKREKPEKANVNVNEKCFPPVFSKEKMGKTGKTGESKNNSLKTEKPEKPTLSPERAELEAQQPTSLSIPHYLSLTDWRAKTGALCKPLADWEQDLLRAELSKLSSDRQTPCWVYCALKKMKVAPDRIKDNAYRLNYLDFQREVDEMVDAERAELEQRIKKQKEIENSVSAKVPKKQTIIIPRLEKERPKEIYNIEDF